MSSTILVTSRSFGSGSIDLTAQLAQAGYRVIRADPSHRLAEIGPILAHTIGWIAGTGPVTEQHLSLAPHLKVLARYGVGYDQVDVAEATRRGVVVTNTPGANTEAVAEHTVALLLAALRGIPAANRRVREGDWSGWRARELSALTVGVVGLGRIGRTVIHRLTGFGPRLLGADPWVPPSDPLFNTIERCDIDALATDCDVVTLHAPGGQRVIDQRWLTASDRPVIVVNTARADLIDETALSHALRRGRVITFAADTLANENDGHDESPLLAEDLADQVIITPHLAAQTREGIDAMGRMATENLLAVLSGRAPANLVAAP